ncbi:hypothetical protein Cgig2_028448 [Carnegiea gigantea]|uniref:Uncharacterized protein n=1 Tax=Carnegiea gigantea TaxID=171969 RepID=A0A9Q1KPH9_9CARY|nr:hypothetical protein Cgig2_028448 [Carnegiea gigantea]
MLIRPDSFPSQGLTRTPFTFPSQTLQRTSFPELYHPAHPSPATAAPRHPVVACEVHWSAPIEGIVKLVSDSADHVKKHRGPTLLFDVHARALEDRVPIFFNEHGQPIGPTEKACDEFSKFLGTIAYEHSWVPLIYTNWHKVPDKDKMWEYVNGIIVNENGEFLGFARLFYWIHWQFWNICTDEEEREKMHRREKKEEREESIGSIKRCWRPKLYMSNSHSLNLYNGNQLLCHRNRPSPAFQPLAAALDHQSPSFVLLFLFVLASCTIAQDYEEMESKDEPDVEIIDISSDSEDDDSHGRISPVVSQPIPKPNLSLSSVHPNVADR